MDSPKSCEANVPLHSNDASLDSTSKEMSTITEDFCAEGNVPMNTKKVLEDSVRKDLSTSNEESALEVHVYGPENRGEASAEPGEPGTEPDVAGAEPHGAGAELHAAGAEPHGAGAEPHGAGAEPHGAGAQQHGACAEPRGVCAEPHGAGAQPHGACAGPHGADAQPHGACAESHGVSAEPSNDTKLKRLFKCNCDIFPSAPGTLRVVPELRSAISNLISASFQQQSFEERQALIMAYRDHLIRQGNIRHTEIIGPRSGRIREEDKADLEILTNQLAAKMREFRYLIGKSRIHTRMISHDTLEAGAQPHEAVAQPHGAGAELHGAGAELHAAGAEPLGAGAEPHGAGAEPHGAGAQQHGACAGPHGACAGPLGADAQPHGACAESHGVSAEPSNDTKLKRLVKCNRDIFPSAPGTLRVVPELPSAISNLISASFQQQSFEERHEFIMAYRDHLIRQGNIHHTEIIGPRSRRIREEDKADFEILTNQLAAKMREFRYLTDKAEEPGAVVSEEDRRRMYQLAIHIMGYRAAARSFLE